MSSINYKRLKIQNDKGVELSARLALPATQHAEQFAIFAHCFTCGCNYKAIKYISSELTRHGFGVVSFDFTGLGHSEGEFKDSHFSSNVSDLIAVHRYMSAHYIAPKLLIGHSLGGAAVLVAGHALEAVEAVSTIGAPAHVAHVKKHFAPQVGDIAEDQEAKVTIGGRPFKIDKDFIEDFDKIDLLEIVHQLRKPLLIMHAPHDTIVDIKNAKEIYDAAYHPKSFVSLDEADHLLSDENDGRYAGAIIGAWVQRYFPEEDQVENAGNNTHAEATVAHVDLSDDGFFTTVKHRNHEWFADEPKKVGGTNLGPTPIELLEASIATCTAMTIKMYALRKEWKLDDAYVHIKSQKLEDGSTEIIKSIELQGDLDEKQKNRLREIGNKCPVHKILTHPITITDSTD